MTGSSSRACTRTETQIQAAVKDALERIGCMMWRQPNAPVPRIGKDAQGQRTVAGFRRSATVGLPDLGGIAPGGRAIQVEVKRPGQKPRPDQAAWLDRVALQGGIAMLATSVDDVQRLHISVRSEWTVGRTQVDAWNAIRSPWSLK